MEAVWASELERHTRCERGGYLYEEYGALPPTINSVKHLISHTVYENLVEFLFDEINKKSQIPDVKIAVQEKTIDSIDSVIKNFENEIDKATINESTIGFIRGDRYFNRKNLKLDIKENVSQIIDNLDPVLNRWQNYELHWLREEKLMNKEKSKSMEFRCNNDYGVGGRNDFVVFFKSNLANTFKTTNLEIKPKVKNKIWIKGKQVYSPEVIQTVAGYFVLKKHVDSFAKMVGLEGEYRLSDSMLFFEYRTGYFPVVKVDEEMVDQMLRRAKLLRGYSRSSGMHPTREEWFSEERCSGCWWDEICEKESLLEEKVKDKQVLQ